MVTVSRCGVSFGAAAVAVALALPVAAQARTKTVVMGLPPDQVRSSGIAEDVEVNDFFPRGVTVRRGDRVAFQPAGFHTVDFPRRGGRPLAPFVPTGQQVSGVNDAAGNPFWFTDRVPVIGFNPELLRSKFGKRVSYNGSRRVQSGLPIPANPGKPEPPDPMVVKFKRTGTFGFFCDIHPGMKGTVKVVSRRKDVPSARADKRRAARQVKATARTARQLESTTPPQGTVYVGAAGRNGVELMRFFPPRSTVPVGTALQFAMSPGSYEAHTATTGPGAITDNSSYLGGLAASMESPAPDPRVVYASDPPGSIAGLTPSLHGNGFWNTGVMDGVQASPPPSAGSVRFDQPGEYTFYCLIHPHMKGTVVAQ